MLLFNQSWTDRPSLTEGRMLTWPFCYCDLELHLDTQIWQRYCENV